MTADLGPAATPRPIESQEDRMRHATQPTDRTVATYLDASERDQLDARAATAEQERDEALDARDVLRTQLDQTRADLERALNAKYAALGEVGRLRRDLADAQELIAVYDDLDEQRDRARARYATRPGSAAPRAQGDDLADQLAAEAAQYRWTPDPDTERVLGVFTAPLRQAGYGED